MKIKGAIFDLDGTLMDSMPIWERMGSNYLISKGIEPEPGLDEIVKSLSIVQGIAYIRERYGITDQFDEIMREVDRQVEHLYAETVMVKDGMRDLLERLSGQNVAMCVATANNRYHAEAALERNQIAGYFSRIFSCTEVGCGKDDPRIYETARAFLGTPKDQTVVYEDALYAVETAKKAGFPVVGVYDACSESQWSRICALADETIGGDLFIGGE